MGCIYRITFPSGKSYIGITTGTAKARFAEHVYSSSRSSNRVLDRAIRKYGADSVTLSTLAIADWPYLLDLERRAILAFGTFGIGGYNMTAGGEGALGYKHTEESLLRMGAIHKGKRHHTQPHSTEAKAKMRAAKTGISKSAAHCASISRALIGNKYSLGCRASDATKRSIAMAIRGKAKATATVGVVGVSVDRQTGRWRATLTIKGRTIHLGRFGSIEEATAARAVGEEKYFTERYA